jgi:acyl-[acyl-carrier-protein]-phospholipid O-acyltransferase/long-chain-fatty-acid--[acyl-carrier-protein] ligase
MNNFTPYDSLGNRSFAAFSITQFFGAFNDNLFKQLMLLLAATSFTTDLQGVATVAFALPFMAFSGYAGQFSEIHSKTKVMLWAKLGELVIMLIGCLGFFLGNWPILFFALFCMGLQSAFFGPAKYGILPELLQNRLLVAANGIIQMMTFLAIIFGMMLAGFLIDYFEGNMTVVSLFCVVIAIMGIVTVLGIAKQQPNKPEMKFDWNPVGRLWPTLKGIFHDKPLWMALYAGSFFWFSGGMVVQVVNNYGLTLLDLGKTGTSMLQGFIAIGIMVGCLLAGVVQRMAGSKFTVLIGGIAVAVVEVGLFFYELPLPVIKGLLIAAGVSTGLYYIPLATFMQQRPRLGEKGEVIGAQNFSHQACIMASGFVYLLSSAVGLPSNFMWLFMAIAGVILLAIMYKDLDALDHPEKDRPEVF